MSTRAAATVVSRMNLPENTFWSTPKGQAMSSVAILMAHTVPVNTTMSRKKLMSWHSQRRGAIHRERRPLV